MKTLVHGFYISSCEDPDKWDWQRLKNSGVRFVVVPASCGTIAANDALCRYRALANQHELCFGAAHVYETASSAEAQLATFEHCLVKSGGLRADDLLPVLTMDDSRASGEESPAYQEFQRGCCAMARGWKKRYGGAILRYSSGVSPWFGAREALGAREWMLAAANRHWVIDDGAPAGRPRVALGSTWDIHHFGSRSLLEYDAGAVEVDVNTQNTELDSRSLRICAAKTRTAGDLRARPLATALRMVP